MSSIISLYEMVASKRFRKTVEVIEKLVNSLRLPRSNGSKD